MKARRTLLRISALALLSAAGIVGMLLADGVWDALFFMLAALPLLVGGWRAAALRNVPPRRVRQSSEISQ